MNEHDWTERTYFGIPADGLVHDVVMPVSATDHPGALVVALHAPMAVKAYQHINEVPDLDVNEIYHVLVSVGKAHASIGALVDQLIWDLRQAGGSWETIGAALDIHRSSAKSRYQTILRARARGTSTMALLDQDAADGAQ